MSPAASRGWEVRQRLLTAAAELIPERGWSAVSTRNLAERAGVNPSVVHYHFPSLPALLNEAVLGILRQVLGEVDTVLDNARTPAEAVEAVVSAAQRYTGDDPTSLLAIEAYLAAARGEPLRDEVGGMVAEFRHRFGRWLGEHGVPDPETTAGLVLATVDGLLLHRGMGAGMDTDPTAAVLRRLVG
ncbi:TetR/AcrR family transcriptional regulator [Saccharomonospora iraqiensis]|uniref:TetR/AcrR family transcriptional regulator n=1 Tax=Saccharomonospora iraqiensis TaxID=52698 RepID=UPI00022E246F|nr:TetR/AcrR family transcriptional regulator [Saccharomonospora iraqiensis]